MIVSTVSHPRVGLIGAGTWENAFMQSRKTEQMSANRTKGIIMGQLTGVGNEYNRFVKVKKSEAGFNVC